MSLATLAIVLGVLLSLVAIIKGVIPAWRGFKRGFGRFVGALDNLGGRDPFIDHATGRLVERIPPLGERLSGIESTLVSLVNVNTRLDNHENRLDGIDHRLDGHDSAVGGLIGDKFDSGAHAALAAVEKAQAGAIDEEQP